MANQMHSPHGRRSHQAARTVLYVVGDAFTAWLRGGDLSAELVDHIAAIIADAMHDAVQTAVNDIRTDG
jgi:hypothetical protein